MLNNNKHNLLVPGTLVKDVKEEPTKPFIVMSFGTGMCPEVSVKDYNVSKVEGALGAGRFLLGVKEFAETIVEQVSELILSFTAIIHVRLCKLWDCR